LTRGDGVIGEDLTEKTRPIRLLPLCGATDLKDFEVRAGVVMRQRAIDRLNAESDEKRLSRFANPRNTAAGSLRVLEPQITESRRLEYYTYFLLEGGQPASDSHWESLARLKKMGFKLNPNAKICQGVDEVLSFCAHWEAQRESLPYEIDGVV